MYPIYQRCLSDCFPTCVAMVAGISHRQAIRLIHPFHIKGEPYYTDDESAIKALRILGFKVKKRYTKNFTSLKWPAILIVDYDEYAHTVVWDPDKKMILEPSRKDQLISISEYQERLEHLYIISR